MIISVCCQLSMKTVIIEAFTIENKNLVLGKIAFIWVSLLLYFRHDTATTTIGTTVYDHIYYC